LISNLSVAGFKAVPYLEASALMRKYNRGLRFSTAKPNVIVGPNGSGKSALINSLALRFLAHFTGRSEFDDKYITSSEAREWWTKERDWGDEYTWMKGLSCKSDNGPAIYYRPAHIPGNETSVVHAMMTGYFAESRAYAELVEHKSSGEQSQAVMKGMVEALSGRGLPSCYGYKNWRFGKDPSDLYAKRAEWAHRGGIDHQAEVLKALYVPQEFATPLILMDEPEQSLDARAEAALWSAIGNADCAKVQVIVATHSLHPLLNRRKYHIIESEEGFIDAVLGAGW
jgi:ABC-type cobalamin/Fe3+-siderophores transport system ATPase subunit